MAFPFAPEPPGMSTADSSDDDDIIRDYPDDSDAFVKNLPAPNATPDSEEVEFDRDFDRRVAAQPAVETVQRWEGAYHQLAEDSAQFIEVVETRSLLRHLRAAITGSPTLLASRSLSRDAPPHQAIRFIVDVYDRCFPKSQIMNTEEWLEKFKSVGNVPTFHLTVILIEALRAAAKEHPGDLERGTWCEVDEDGCSLRFNTPFPLSLAPLKKFVTIDAGNHYFVLTLQSNTSVSRLPGNSSVAT